MNHRTGIFSIALIAASLAATAAEAHPAIGGVSGFSSGFLHPLAGLDHVLAMTAVGLFACVLGGRALWLVPATFVGMMAAGGLAGAAGVALPFVETAIALSVVVIGGLAALGRSMPVAVAMATVGVFAVFHGHVHGSEMPATASGLAYGAGFMLATAALHGAGIAAGLGVGRLAGARGAGLVRAGGAAMATAGLALLGGLV